MDAPPVQYVTTDDGYDIAYTVRGEGRPILMLPLPFNHVQTTWNSTYVTSILGPLSERGRLICFDARGLGMSTRGLREDHSFQHYLPDVEAVVGRLGSEPFTLVSANMYWRLAVYYAERHPERVRALVLVDPGWYDPGALHHPFEAMAEGAWGTLLTFIAGAYQPPPGQPSERIDDLSQAIDQFDYVKVLRACRSDRMEQALAALDVPTFIVVENPQGSSINVESIDAGRRLTNAIQGAQLSVVEVPAKGHAFMTTGPETSPGIRLIDQFLAGLTPDVELPHVPSPTLDTLSPREVEVLRLLATGKSNQQIAEDLVISLNTVRRHVSNIFDKTGVANRSQAALYARDKGFTGA